MKLKHILGLALVLGGGAFGCSTANEHRGQMQNSDKQSMIKRIKVGMTQEQVEAIIFPYHPFIRGQNGQPLYDAEITMTQGVGSSTCFPLDDFSKIWIRWNQGKVQTVKLVK